MQRSEVVNKLSLFLLSSPTLASMLLMLLTDKPAQAVELDRSTRFEKVEKAPKANLTCSQNNCTGNASLASFTDIFVKETGKDNLSEKFPNLERTPEGDLILEFTEEESNSAIALFGCDCVKSINALRQIRGISIGVEGNKILPGPVIKPCNQRAPEIDK